MIRSLILIGTLLVALSPLTTFADSGDDPIFTPGTITGPPEELRVIALALIPNNQGDRYRHDAFWRFMIQTYQPQSLTDCHTALAADYWQWDILNRPEVEPISRDMGAGTVYKQYVALTADARFCASPLPHSPRPDGQLPNPWAGCDGTHCCESDTCYPN